MFESGKRIATVVHSKLHIIVKIQRSGHRNIIYNTILSRICCLTATLQLHVAKSVDNKRKNNFPRVARTNACKNVIKNHRPYESE